MVVVVIVVDPRWLGLACTPVGALILYLNDELEVVYCVLETAGRSYWPWWGFVGAVSLEPHLRRARGMGKPAVYGSRVSPGMGMGDTFARVPTPHPTPHPYI